MRVLVTGAAGQLGHDLVRTCTEAGDEVVACTSSQLDLGDRDSVAQAITATHPDVVVNAGAWTAVDACESEAIVQRVCGGEVLWAVLWAITPVFAHCRPPSQRGR